MVKKMFSSIALSMLLGASLSADPVSISSDGSGDFLIAPAYMANNSECSDITIMNTYTTNSILAKVAVREQNQSNEVDIPIFLSPGDVWDAKICDVNGKPVLTSNDDSNHPALIAKLQRGLDLNVHSEQAGNNGDFSQGYIEVYPIAQFNESASGKIEKSVLVARWDQLIKGDTSNPKLNKDNHGVHGFGLSGYVKINNGLMQMTAFKGVSDRVVSGATIDYGNDTSPETLLGLTKKNEILKLLSNSEISVPYVNGGKNQYVYFTYVFDRNSDQSRKYNVEVRDMEENLDRIYISPAPASTMPKELAVISLEDLVNKTTDPMKFQKGMIKIKNITNQHNGQMGQGKQASFIPTLVIKGQYSSSSGTQFTGVYSWARVPAK